MNAAGHDHERRVIRDAMDRLLAGDAIRSDGKLTVKSLAAEAGLKRYRLTHVHTDLQDEFRDRIRIQGATPDAMRTLHARIAALEESRKEERAERRQAVADRKRLARVVRLLAREKKELTDEIEQLRELASGTAPKVTSIRSRPVLAGRSDSL